MVLKATVQKQSYKQSFRKTQFRSKIGVSQNFRNRKTPALESIFNKVAGLKVCNFMKMRLQHWFLTVNFKIYPRTTYRTPVVAFVSLIM